MLFSSTSLGGLVTEYRSFLNTDPPMLIDLWQQQRPFRCFSAFLNRKLLEQFVLSKPYFDPAGLILAIDGYKPLGFVHAGFGPSPELNGLDYSTGIMLQLRTVGGDAPEDFSLTDELLNRGMDYLRTKGAASCFAASRFPFSPFYTGLYGGSRVPGVPYEDADTISRLTRFGFETGERIAVFQCGVSAFRPPMNRQQLALRRQYQVNAIVDPRLSSWWDCCTYGHAEIMGFRLVRRCDQTVVASMILWEIQPLSTQWGRLTLGLIDLWVDQGERRRGLATLLVGETIRQVATQGVLCIEVQIRETNEPAIGFVRSLGFEQISFGIEMKKKLL